MSTPPTQGSTKSVRIPPETHARLQNVASGLHDATMGQAIEWLMSPGMVRVWMEPEQRKRWKEAADASGMTLGDFVIARVEASLAFGVDPGVLRRIHDMTYALTKAAGITPRQLSTPGADRQVIADPKGRPSP